MTNRIRFATLVLAASSLALGGCAGVDLASFPAVPTQNPVGSIQGSDFGGHAPITGAHIFLLEAVWNGYGTTAKSLLAASSTATSGTFPVAQDVTAGSPTIGLFYVTSNNSGEFSVTGDYTCDVGWPVYLYASGGTPGGSAPIAITGISSTLSGGITTYTFTAANLLYSGQTVQFSSSSLGGKWATLNGSTQTVLATPTTTSFQISTTTASSGSNNLQAGSATATGPTNPAIVNLAMLGNCPGVGNFTSSIHYVYLNEVATVATAYAMSGFATDGLHIGSTTTNQTGIENAALNAANLYNIQGGPYEFSGNSSAGEGQIANQATLAGNGTVPQSELDSLGNILAACVDSANTTGSPSSTCTMLFADATSTGLTGGTKPTDIATAAFNITNNPGTANVLALFALASGAVPFSPQLSAAPKDFTVAITYNNIATPSSVAIDAAGNAYVPTNSTSGYVTKLSSQGAVLKTSATAGSGFDSIAVAPNGNVYVTATASNAVYQFTSSLGVVTGSPLSSPTMTAPTSVIADSSGNVYVTDGAASLIRKFSSAGTLTASIGNGCLLRVTQLAIDPSDDLWAAMNTSNSICRISNSAGTAVFTSGAETTSPGNVAIDSSGNGWVSSGAQTNLYTFTPGGQPTSVGVANNVILGGLASPTWIAIDGANDLWITNAGNSYALSEFANTGSPITGTSGYQGGVLNAPSFLAIDASGDVWIPNAGNNTVTELIGVATPVVTPLSAQRPGTRP
jgi:streptogramin lyase